MYPNHYSLFPLRLRQTNLLVFGSWFCYTRSYRRSIFLHLSTKLMNTRSSTAGRKCPMTVDCSSQRSENHSIIPDRQAKLNSENNKEISKVVNDIKRKPRLEVSGVDEGEPKRKSARQDKTFNIKDDSNCGVTTRSNVRPGKRARTQTPERSLSVTPESSKSGNKRLETGRKRKKRQWESWAPNEKDCFFEALNEHSKDFDKIQTYLKKRRGDLSAAVRNKDQVRHFYYRTLNKISKYIPEPPDPSDAKKTHHEVRSLICYGELRKKFRSLKEKDGKKLTELISTGKTTFRYHGRNVNIRAPTCRALKKLNATVAEEHEQIPQKIMIELIPSDNKTWSVIQGLAHNPRLRTTVSARKTVCSLITFLISKWKLQDINISLSSCNQFGSKQVGNKTNEAVPKVKPSCEVTGGSSNGEVMLESTESPKNKISKAAASFINSEASTSVKSASCINDASPQIENVDNAKERGLSEINHVQNILKQDKWDKSNSGNLTIADVYRKMNNPRKILLKYSLCQIEAACATSTNQALEQLVKLASGEFNYKNCNKKEVANVSSSKSKVVSKDTVTVSKASRVTKPKSAAKPQKPLAPKPPQEVIIPTVVSPSVINQVLTNSTTKSGNHLTFGFTPINSFPRPSPFLPKTRKGRAPRVVVQRTLLPRPCTGIVGTSAKGPPIPFVPSPTAMASSNALMNSGLVNKPRVERKILPKQPNVPNTEPSSTTALPSSENISMDTLLKIAMNQDLPEHLEFLSKALSLDKNASDANHVCTEEIDSGIAGNADKPVKGVQNLNEAIKHLESTKPDHVDLRHSVDLLDNLKSSEDEDPFKFLSPSHLPSFPPESWLNEESTDISLGTLFANFETSPVKSKPSSGLDTPKKSGAASDSDSKYSHTAPIFSDMMDENSVDYVKKFRDLAKRMGNDDEASSSDNVDAGASATLSFKSLLSEASKY